MLGRVCVHLFSADGKPSMWAGDHNKGGRLCFSCETKTILTLCISIRWISSLEPLKSLLREIKALLVLFDAECERLLLYAQLTDAQLYVAMHAVKPALESVNCFIKLCQSRELRAVHR